MTTPTDRVQREGAAHGDPEERLGRDPPIAPAEVEVEVHPGAHEHRGGADEQEDTGSAHDASITPVM